MKILIVGYGSIGKRHVNILSKNSNIKIIICTKRKLQHLEKKGHQVINKGYDGEESVDYPDFIHPVSEEVKNKSAK